MDIWEKVSEDVREESEKGVREASGKSPGGGLGDVREGSRRESGRPPGSLREGSGGGPGKGPEGGGPYSVAKPSISDVLLVFS